MPGVRRGDASQVQPLHRQLGRAHLCVGLQRRVRGDGIWRVCICGGARDCGWAGIGSQSEGVGPDEHGVDVGRDSGRFLDEPGLLVANRTFDTEPGFWFVAPLELDDGRIVLVSRGWIPRDVAAGQSQQRIEAVDGRVTVTGRLFASVDGGRLGSPVNGVPQVSRLDLDTAQDAIGLEVVDRWVQAEDPDWRRGVIPIPVPRPTLDEGPHLSYAFQWFFFSASTVIAYALILRRRRAEAAIPRNDQ